MIGQLKCGPADFFAFSVAAARPGRAAATENAKSGNWAFLAGQSFFHRHGVGGGVCSFSSLSSTTPRRPPCGPCNVRTWGRPYAAGPRSCIGGSKLYAAALSCRGCAAIRAGVGMSAFWNGHGRDSVFSAFLRFEGSVRRSTRLGGFCQIGDKHNIVKRIMRDVNGFTGHASGEPGGMAQGAWSWERPRRPPQWRGTWSEGALCITWLIFFFATSALLDSRVFRFVSRVFRLLRSLGLVQDRLRTRLGSPQDRLRPRLGSS